MNHTTPHPALPDSNPYAVFHLRIALARRRLDNLFSLISVGALLLMPVLFAVAHIAADGAVWNFATGEKFNPMFDVMSSYAWRSPAGWAMVACMVGFAWVLGFISWHAAKRGPGFLAWFTAVMAAIAMVKMLEVAWYPFKPSRETFSQIQQEMDQEPTKEIELEIWSGGLYAVGLPLPEGIASPQYFKTLRSSWIHEHGIGGAQVLIILTIMGSRLLWDRRGPDRRFWSRAQWVVLLFVVGGAFGRVFLPDLNGVTQRVAYLGIYIWMLIIVREIELLRLPAAEMNLKNVGETPTLLEETPNEI